MKIRSFIIQWVVVAVVASIAVACSHKPTVDSTQSSSDTCTLERQLLEVINATPGVMGIAVVSDSDTLVVNGGVRFPMMSVFKLHQALATLLDFIRYHGNGLELHLMYISLFFQRNWIPKESQHNMLNM